MRAKRLRERFREVGIRLEQGSGPTVLGHRLIVTYPAGVNRDAVYANLVTAAEAVIPGETVKYDYPSESNCWGQVKGRPCIVVYTHRESQRTIWGLTAG